MNAGPLYEVFSRLGDECATFDRESEAARAKGMLLCESDPHAAARFVQVFEEAHAKARRAADLPAAGQDVA